MAGPYTGSWRAASVSAASYTGAAKWGTGVNPVHSVRTEGPNIITRSKLNIDPVAPPGGQDTETIAEDYAWQNTFNDDPNLEAYNVTDPSLWAANDSTGTKDRPSWGQDMADADSPVAGVGLPNPQVPGRPIVVTRGTSQNATGDDFPGWNNDSKKWDGGSRPTGPGGRFIRALRRGSDMIVSARVLPNEDVAQGWENKAKGNPSDSRPADDSQVFMQTSMTQRYKVREGSQRAGSQSEYAAPIESRVIGKKVKTYSAQWSSRHWDMLPYEQEDYLRPFLSRQAGTGYREWAAVNEMYVSPALQREPAPDPELGPIPGIAQGDGYDYSLTPTYGYSYEDGGVFY